MPKVVADVGPGGPLVTSMRGINALSNDMLLKKINEARAKYAPMTAQADAASKLAYANLMGPQFLAKIMGNDSALANMSEDQKRQALALVSRAGMGQQGNNSLSQLSQPQNPMNQGTGNSLSGYLSNKIKNTFESTPQSSNMQMPTQAAIQVPTESMGAPSSNQLVPGKDFDNNAALDAYDMWLKSPQGLAEISKGEKAVIPDEKQVVAWANAQNGIPRPSQSKPSYAENTGSYKGIVAEGTETGKIRAKDIEELNNTVFNAETHQSTLDDLSSILSSPQFEQIRQVPLLGHNELSYYAKEGTPEQQQLVGRYFTDTGNIVKDSARDFAGQFRKGEQQLLSGMKPNPSDTVDTARGKLESLSYFNKMLAERSRLTSKIMSEYHVNKLAAQEAADQKINGEQIRRGIHDKLNPTITIRNKKTGETKTISIAEARKLGVPNV